MRWSLEPATHGIGKWIVGRGEDRLEVIAAPGARMPSAERDDPYALPAGWRHAAWKRPQERRLNIDREAPDSALHTIGTCEVLDTIDVRLHGYVREILTQQLAHLTAMQTLPAMTAHSRFKDEARQDIGAIAWVQAELAEAFPDSFPDHLPRNRNPMGRASGAGPVAHASTLDPPPGPPGNAEREEEEEELRIPDTVQALQLRIRPHVYSEGLGGRELWRLLRRRLGWRVMERLPRAVLVMLFAGSRNGREPHELVTRMLILCAFQYDWPLVTDLDKAQGRLQSILAVGWPDHYHELRSHNEVTLSVRNWLHASARIGKARRSPRQPHSGPTTQLRTPARAPARTHPATHRATRPSSPAPQPDRPRPPAVRDRPARG
jgi:hypothetical protein